MKRVSIIVFLLFSISSSILHAFDWSLSKQNKEQSAETVVLIHGLGRNNTAMWLMAKRLKEAGYHVERVGYDSLKNTPEQILNAVSKQIDSCCIELEKPVHFVGHSLGGLLIRAYLGDHHVKNLGKVVLIGSPSNGTPVVDLYKDTWWIKLAGDTALALGTDNEGFPQTLPKPYYPLGIIAGTTENTPFSKKIPGADDGLVPVDSTLVEGMDDFIILPTNHSMMRYNKAVLEQTKKFLKQGQFEHEQSILN